MRLKIQRLEQLLRRLRVSLEKLKISNREQSLYKVLDKDQCLAVKTFKGDSMTRTRNH